LGPGQQNNKKDVASMMHSANSTESQKGNACFVTVDYIQLKNLDAKKCPGLRHIMIEMSYGKAKLHTKVTINLGMTRNRQILGEKFQIFLKDVSEKIQQQS
jgi:hypothetical protein